VSRMNPTRNGAQATRDRCSGEPCFHASIRSVSELTPLLHQLALQMSALGHGNTDRFSVCLAVRDVVAHTVKRVHRLDRVKPLEVSFLVRADYVVCEIIDGRQGAGIPGSAGLPATKGAFMTRLMFWVNR
jgi:hypothetical protein